MTFVNWRRRLLKSSDSKKQKGCGNQNDGRAHHQPSVAIIMLRVIVEPSRVPASWKLAEGAVLGMAERISEVPPAVGPAREPGQLGSVAQPSRGTCHNLHFTGHSPSDSGTVFAKPLCGRSNRNADSLGRNRAGSLMGRRRYSDCVHPM